MIGVENLDKGVCLSFGDLLMVAQMHFLEQYHRRPLAYSDNYRLGLEVLNSSNGYAALLEVGKIKEVRSRNV